MLLQPSLSQAQAVNISVCLTKTLIRLNLDPMSSPLMGINSTNSRTLIFNSGSNHLSKLTHNSLAWWRRIHLKIMKPQLRISTDRQVGSNRMTQMNRRTRWTHPVSHSISQAMWTPLHSKCWYSNSQCKWTSQLPYSFQGFKILNSKLLIWWPNLLSSSKQMEEVSNSSQASPIPRQLRTRCSNSSNNNNSNNTSSNNCRLLLQLDTWWCLKEGSKWWCLNPTWPLEMECIPDNRMSKWMSSSKNKLRIIFTVSTHCAKTVTNTISRLQRMTRTQVANRPLAEVATSRWNKMLTNSNSHLNTISTNQLRVCLEVFHNRSSSPSPHNICHSPNRFSRPTNLSASRSRILTSNRWFSRIRDLHQRYPSKIQYKGRPHLTRIINRSHYSSNMLNQELRYHLEAIIMVYRKWGTRVLTLSHLQPVSSCRRIPLSRI